MRIAVSGSKDLMGALADELPTSGVGRVVRVESAKDDSDLAFSLGDVETVVSVVTGLMPFCELLVGAFRRRRAPEQPATQTLRFKTALGTTEVQLSADITVEELHAQLETLVRR